MSIWTWVLIGVGGLGLIGAIMITAAVFEMTWMNDFRKWDTLP